MSLKGLRFTLEVDGQEPDERKSSVMNMAGYG